MEEPVHYREDLSNLHSALFGADSQWVFLRERALQAAALVGRAGVKDVVAYISSAVDLLVFAIHADLVGAGGVRGVCPQGDDCCAFAWGRLADFAHVDFSRSRDWPSADFSVLVVLAMH